MIVVPHDVVSGTGVENGQPGQPLLNPTNLGGNPRATPLGLAIQPFLEGPPDRLGQRFTGGLGKGTCQTIRFRVLDTYRHFYLSRQ